MSQNQTEPKERKSRAPLQIVLYARAEAMRRIEEYERAMNAFLNSPMMRSALEQARKQHELMQRVQNQLKESGVFDAVDRLAREASRWQSLMERPKLDAETSRAIVLAPNQSYELHHEIIAEQRLLRKDVADLKRLVENLPAENKPQEVKILTEKDTIIKLPIGTQWDDLEMKFENKFDVSIYYKGKFLKKYDYIALGFSRTNTTDKKSDKQWDFLIKLSITYKNSRLMEPTVENLSRELKMTKATCMKTKENLAKKLLIAFGIENDPFHEYDPEKGYRTKFKLQPEALLRSNKNPYSYGAQYNDNLEYRDSGKQI